MGPRLEGEPERDGFESADGRAGKGSVSGVVPMGFCGLEGCHQGVW